MNDHHLGALIAQGRTADIHAWEDTKKVVKLYHNWFLLDWIKQEAARTRAVQSLGLPIPWIGEHVNVSGRNGIILERLYGDNMLAVLIKHPERALAFATRLADLHFALHTVDAKPEIPAQPQKLAAKIEQATQLSDKTKTQLLARLQMMPLGSAVCHGDFHPGNIVLSESVAPHEYIVDWNDCTFGNPIADVARSTILMLGGITGNETPNPSLEQLVTSFHQQYITRYFDLSPHSQEEHTQWLPIVAGARLSENITALEPWLLAEAEKVND